MHKCLKCCVPWWWIACLCFAFRFNKCRFRYVQPASNQMLLSLGFYGYDGDMGEMPFHKVPMKLWTIYFFWVNFWCRTSFNIFLPFLADFIPNVLEIYRFWRRRYTIWHSEDGFRHRIRIAFHGSMNRNSMPDASKFGTLQQFKSITISTFHSLIWYLCCFTEHVYAVSIDVLSSHFIGLPRVLRKEQPWDSGSICRTQTTEINSSGRV